MQQPFSSMLVLAQGADLSTWIALTIGALALIYVFMRPRQKRSDPLAVVPNFNLNQKRNVEREMETLLVELSNMTRQMTAQLDTRSAKLELLIKDADDRIAALKGLAGNGADAGGAGATVPINPVVPDMPEEAAVPSPVEPPVADQTPRPSLLQPLPPDHPHAEVYALSDSGQSAHDIARHLARPFGEVELILALRRSEGR